MTWATARTLTRPTARKPGSSQPDLIFDITCLRQDDTGVLFPALLNRYGLPGLTVSKGDYHYDNPGSNASDDLTLWQWIKAWHNQDDLIPGLKQLVEHNILYRPDDHEFGVDNATFNHPNIDRCIEAFKLAFPVGPGPVGMPPTGTFYSSIQRGEVEHIAPLFTNNQRSDPAAPNVAWNPGDPRPTKTPFGTEQDQWLEDLLLHDPRWDSPDGGIVAAILYLNKGWGGTAPLTGSTGKTDHHAHYPAHRAWLGWMCSLRRTMLITGDNHYFGKHSNDPYSQSPLLHVAGALRESGNTTWNPELEQTYPDPPNFDPPGEEDGVPLEGAGVIKTSRQGDQFTISACVYDALADEERVPVSRTWTVPGVGTRGWSINGESLQRNGFSVLVNGSDPTRVAPKRGENKTIAGVDGREPMPDKPYDQGDVTLRILTRGTSSAERQDRIDWLNRLLDSGDDADDGMLVLRHEDEHGEREARAEAVAAISHNKRGPHAAVTDVLFTLPRPHFRDSIVTVQELKFEPDADGRWVGWFTAFAGSSAPIDDLVLRLKGNFPDPLVSDPVSRRVAGRYAGLVNAGNVLEINSELGTVTETQGGTGLVNDKIPLWDRRGGGRYLYLKPRLSDGAYGVRINVSSAPSGNPTVELVARRAHKSAG